MALSLNVKSLRLRLGWTQSDLSRRLNCQVSEIVQWEAGLSDPNANYAGLLQLLFSQAEACVLDTQSAARAEIFCNKKDILQVSRSGLREFDKN